MIKLYKEYQDQYELYGTYETDRDARLAINQYCENINFKSYYWNCYIMSEDEEFPGATHVDFGSWSIFFVIVEEN